MKFGPTSVDQSGGATLAHSIRLPGGAIKKGTVLGPTEIERATALEPLAQMELLHGSADAAEAQPHQPKKPTVTGLPLLYRGLSESVRDNQLTSLVSALLLVWLTVSWLFRRISAGLLADSLP